MSHAAPGDDEPIAEPVAEALAEPLPQASLAAESNPDRVDTAQLLYLGRDEAEPSEPAPDVRLRRWAPTLAAVLGVLGAIGGLFVVWMTPFAVAGIVFADFARRQGQRSTATTVGYISGSVGVLFGGVWLIYILGLFA